MCGIAGILQLDGSAPPEGLIQRMTATLAHRGPDGAGCQTMGPIALGHRRLAILDLSEAGRQPMTGEDGQVWITYNGEIYNYRELRRTLERSGHRFHSATDTEVIIHAYEEWGFEALARLNGMFAFGLWDGRRNRLWLARDRLGIKPLFYARVPGALLFGSEIKALLPDPRLARELDLTALAYFLGLNYMPAPHTLLAPVRQLRPGEYLVAEPGGALHCTRYWRVPEQPSPDRPAADWIADMQDQMAAAVEKRLVSDVPFGVFLSGGVDSSAVAYWMAQAMNTPVHSFSIGFDDTGFDERRYARLAAAGIGATHREEVVTADVARLLPRLVWHAEEPTADSSMVAVYYLAQLARRHVTMVLTGDGADEVWAGYDTYAATYWHSWYRRLPAWLRERLIRPLIMALPAAQGKVSWDDRLKRFVAAGDLTPEMAHATWRQINDGPTRQRLLAGLAPRPEARADYLDFYRAGYADVAHQPLLNRLLYVDTTFYLPNDMLVKVDRMTMAHGLEARVPFLDHEFVSFAAAVPPHLKLPGWRRRKHLLRQAMAGRLPETILNRRKAGFNVPNARWLTGSLRPFVREHLSPERLRLMPFLSAPAVQELVRAHEAGRMDNSHAIWGLLTLSLWWQIFISGELNLP